ncbi:MAG TPA: TetR/AcrR family transcriptional regulator [Trebonia sp.]|jgi:TetR/AcrR family transcriptional repressor of lmrAB and yxaGH operons|nr:TetR/AcrR family transcriptional regulator [Trebonia sp.]
MTDRDDAVPALAEAFREHGFEGASLAQLSAATGLGKGSLYNFFPGGKDEMAAAVLANVDAWFTGNVFAPLRNATPGDADAIDAMFDAVVYYFRSGRRVCLQGAFALGRERDKFAATISGYFGEWIESLAAALRGAGVRDSEARASAAEAVAAIQGGIILSRALDEPEVFTQTVVRQRARLLSHFTG